MRLKQTKSIDRLKKRSEQKKKSQAPEIKNLMEMQQQAFDAEMQGAEGSNAFGKASAGLKGLQAAYNLQQEFKEAKSGVQSRYGNIAKALGLANSKQAEMIDKIFGKQLSKEEVQKRKEKFGIKDKEEIAQQKKAKKEETAERIKKRDEMLKEIFDATMETSKILKSVQLSVEGIANKLRASAAKDVPGTKREMRKLEKESGLKYSKESGRYRDVKSGKFVSNETARQRMNISASAVKTATPAGSAAAVSAPPPSASKVDADLQSKSIGGAEIKEAAPTKDPNAGLGKKVDKVQGTLDDIMEIFSLKKFYRLIGGAIGALIPGVVAIGKFLWGVAQKGWAIVTDIASKVWSSIKEFLVGIKLEIPEIMGQFELPNPFGDNFKVGPIGGFTFQPFKFLGGTEKPESMSDVEEPETDPLAKQTQGAAVSGGGNVEPAPSGSAAPAAAPASIAGSAPAGGAAAGAASASRQGTSMPAAAAPAPSSGPPLRLGPAAAGRGKVDPASAKNAALASAAKFGITGPHLAQFMAQLDHESGHFSRVEENLRYSAKRLMQIFPKYYKDPAIAEAEANQPIAIANRVYGGRMGNSQPGDGYKYRGRGLIQLTGKDNYSKFGKIVGIDLVGNPEAAADLATAADIAAAYYKKQVVDRGIDGNDTAKVTKAINGGSIGLADRKAKFEEYKRDPKALQATGPAPAANIPAASTNEAPPPAASKDTSLPSASGGAPVKDATAPVAEKPGNAAAAPPTPPASAPSAAPSSAPTATPVEPTPTTGAEVAQDTTAITSAKEEMVTSPKVVPVPVGGGGGGSREQKKPEIQGSPVKAQPRMADDVFNRAIAKDFSHPSAFTSVALL
jgi:predicted chitinase